jgi:hypothetical protein
LPRCRPEIASIEAEILYGNADLQGLCLALADWAGELRLLLQECGQQKPPEPPRRREKKVEEDQDLSE